jgi:hypothetical protein
MVKRRKVAMMKRTQGHLFQMMMTSIQTQEVQEVSMTHTSSHCPSFQGNQHPKRWKRKKPDVLNENHTMLGWLSKLRRIGISVTSIT